VTEPKPIRDYQPRESRLLAEYVAATWPNALVKLHCRLGPPVTNETGQFQSQEELNLLGGAFRRWADAVIVEPTRVIVLEAKMVLHPAVIGQLELYLELVPRTPELAPFLDRPAVGMIVCGQPDPATVSLATRRGYTVATFRPAWFDEWLAVLRRRERRAPTQEVYADQTKPPVE
jgi:hypothetical protein